MTRYWFVLLVLALIFVLEVLGGFFSHSLALLADAGHVLSDGIAVGVTILVTYLVAHGMHERTVRTIGSLANAGLLLATSSEVLHEALGRLEHPSEVRGWPMFVVASVGTLGNLAQHKILDSAGEEHRHLNHRGLVLHVLSDLALSICVIVGGVLVALTKNVLIDPTISVLASMLLASWSGLLLYQTAHFARGTNHHEHHGHTHH